MTTPALPPPTGDAFEMNDRMSGLARLVRDARQLGAVRALHRAVHVVTDPLGGGTPWRQLTICSECRQEWPCRTQQALGVRP